jgi:hypothetical protein
LKLFGSLLKVFFVFFEFIFVIQFIENKILHRRRDAQNEGKEPLEIQEKTEKGLKCIAKGQDIFKKL